MKRPSKKAIREAVQKLHDQKTGGPAGTPPVPKPQEKKGGQSRTRQKSV